MMNNDELARQVKAWRGQIPVRVAAEVLGIPKRTLEGIEQGRGFSYPRLLLATIKTTKLDKEVA